MMEPMYGLCLLCLENNAQCTLLQQTPTQTYSSIACIFHATWIQFLTPMCKHVEFHKCVILWHGNDSNACYNLMWSNSLFIWHFERLLLICLYRLEYDFGVLVFAFKKCFDFSLVSVFFFVFSLLLWRFMLFEKQKTQQFEIFDRVLCNTLAAFMSIKWQRTWRIFQFWISNYNYSPNFVHSMN